MIDMRMSNVRNVPEMLNLAEESFPELEALAFRTDEKEETEKYESFVLKVRKTADYLEHILGRGKIIGIPGAMSREWLYTFFAVLYSGNIAVPLNFQAADDLSFKLDKLIPDALLTDTSVSAEISAMLKDKYAQIPTWTLKEVCDSAFAASQAGTTRDPVDPDTTAMLVFTSGTTGENKIAEITHRNLCADAFLALKYLGTDYPAGTRFLTALPLFHLYAITSCIMSPIMGGYIVCIGEGVWKLKNDIRFFRPHLLMVVPMMVYSYVNRLFPDRDTVTSEQLEAAKAFFGGRLRLLVTGGAPLEKGFSELLLLAGIFLLNGYGITECSPIVSYDVETDHREGSVGKPGIVPELASVKIADGEVCVKGEIVSPGYFREPELNGKVYKDGWFHTGDLGKLDEDGFLFITGRKKNILILPDGNNISLDELEKQLSGCPSVDSAIVLGKGTSGSPVLEAVVYPKKDTGLSVAELEKKIEAEIEEINRINPRYKRIAQIRLLDTDFERTALGKVRKFKYET